MFKPQLLSRAGITSQIRTICRNSILRDAKSESTVSPTVNATTSTATSSANPSVMGKRMHKVTYIDKVALVWMKKYPSIKDVPNQVFAETVLQARSRGRIRVANLMMLVTVVACAAAIWSGKKAAQQGDSITRRNIDWHRTINEEHQKSSNGAKE